jgi:selenium metabolism protein YedF
MTLLYLTSDKMGTGDPVLGKKLLQSFLKELLASGRQVDMIGCVNEAIYLCTGSEESVATLAAFEQGGTRVASCGTCLDHYGVRQELSVGEVGNMAQAVEVLTTADQVIRPT